MTKLRALGRHVVDFFGPHLSIRAGDLALTMSAVIFAGLALSLLSTPAAAETAPADPTALVRGVIQNELHAQATDNSLWCFREQKQDDGNTPKTLEVCQTKDGTLEHLLAVDGRELSATDAAAEDERIKRLIEHPGQLRAKQKKQHEDDEQMRVLLKAVPDAFFFRCVGSEGDLVKLYFWPNPSFRPPTRAAIVFHHLEGMLIINRKENRIAEINGRITTEIRFFGGLLGHLDKGGTFIVKSGEVAPGHWDTELMDLELNGKALFFKTIAVHQLERYADYTPVPATASLPDVGELLRKECSNIHTALAPSEKKPAEGKEIR